MTRNSGPLARRLRFAVAVGCVLAMAAVLAPAASAADNWSGIWNTKHKFGTPKLKLDLDRQRGPDRVEGIYKDNGRKIGNIWGDLSDHRKVWSGRFKDTNGDGSKGKFSVTLKSDEVSFDGWFKTCGITGQFCSERYDWKGEHA
jgi:hypothetical protein